jgi:hypothetical protein
MEDYTFLEKERKLHEEWEDYEKRRFHWTLKQYLLCFVPVVIGGTIGSTAGTVANMVLDGGDANKTVVYGIALAVTLLLTFASIFACSVKRKELKACEPETPKV